MPYILFSTTPLFKVSQLLNIDCFVITNVRIWNRISEVQSDIFLRWCDGAKQLFNKCTQ